jgi:holo-ACP synthase CitX
LTEVSLVAVLRARDDRADYQRELLGGFHLPLVCLTVNMPGPVKTGTNAAAIFDAGTLSIRERLAGVIAYSKLRRPDTGFEGYFVADMAPEPLKAAMCRIEETHPLGRLMDIDVLTPDGAILGREALGLSPRACLICGKPGPGCARSRAHSVEELVARVDAMVEAYTK